MIKRLKNKVFDIFYSEDKQKGFLYLIDDYFISALIIMNVIAIILESYDVLYQSYSYHFKAFEIFSVIVFSIEYMLRFWVADIRFDHLPPWKARVKYVFSPMGLVDLLAILPFYLQFAIIMDLRFVRILRLLRLFRIFKLAHYLSSLKLVGTVFRKQKEELLITVFGTFIIILITSSLMFEIEHQVQPEQFPNIFATFWWAVATLTTIGYGDVYPVTGWGQFLAAVTAIFGIGLVAIPTGILSMGFMEEMQKRKEEKKQAVQKEKEDSNEKKPLNYCPHCGEKLSD